MVKNQIRLGSIDPHTGQNEHAASTERMFLIVQSLFSAGQSYLVLDCDIINA